VEETNTTSNAKPLFEKFFFVPSVSFVPFVAKLTI
jgi:hypothetical protein